MVPLLLGVFAVCFGLVSMVVKEWLFVSETLVAFPVCPADWVDVPSFTLELTRLIIAIQVMAAGITLPNAPFVGSILSTELKSLAHAAGSTIMLVFRLGFIESMLIASCVAPTDPVLANSIVKGKFAEAKVPLHVRNIISAESGANDGLGYPYLYLALYLLKFGTKEALTRWFVVVILWEIVVSVVLGGVIGWCARKLLQYARERGWVDHDSFLSFAISLTLLTLGIVSLVGSDDILACFVAGNTLTWDDWFRTETKEAHFQDVLDTLFNYTFFIYLGAIVPMGHFITPGRLVAVSILVILFRRLPAVLAVTRLTPALVTFREAAFAGWFGPIGVGAIFYAMVAYEELEDPVFEGSRFKESLLPIVFSLVIASVVVHGITIPLYHVAAAVPTATVAVQKFLTLTPSRSSTSLFSIGRRTASPRYPPNMGVSIRKPRNARASNPVVLPDTVRTAAEHTSLLVGSEEQAENYGSTSKNPK
ncbi:hypothetical protein DL89DRAFT_269642 [Linderina pennispora]|uniref:Cation/H+ exchanger transmembrane domain-containing protein n=1 Tax=Linderina pennispora TaxID=61395 RepID=A0A1Y1W141_9FUNG|nr:uncharacterized protein DL89DRAFT_269642 [Linderina pennispora]ORX67221.1 hypothetical protein DL89DRAFT_269642 [Linderina pennispora]